MLEVIKRPETKANNFTFVSYSKGIFAIRQAVIARVAMTAVFSSRAAIIARY
jgi:hypothetical protein